MLTGKVTMQLLLYIPISDRYLTTNQETKPGIHLWYVITSLFARIDSEDRQMFSACAYMAHIVSY